MTRNPKEEDVSLRKTHITNHRRPSLVCNWSAAKSVGQLSKIDKITNMAEIQQRPVVQNVSNTSYS